MPPIRGYKSIIHSTGKDELSENVGPIIQLESWCESLIVWVKQSRECAQGARGGEKLEFWRWSTVEACEKRSIKVLFY